MNDYQTTVISYIDGGVSYINSKGEVKQLMDVVDGKTISITGDQSPIEEIKLILYPLSSISEPTDHDGKTITVSDLINRKHNPWGMESYTPEMIQKRVDNDNLTKHQKEVLFKYNIDFMGLVEKGKAVDANTFGL